MLNRLRIDRLFGSEAAPQNDNHADERLGEAPAATDGWLGITMQRITPTIAAALGLDGTEGVLIADVTAGGPAAGAGLAIGDVITSFAGRKVAAMRDLATALVGLPIGRSVEIGLVRDGKADSALVTIGSVRRGESVVAQDSAVCENRKLGLILGSPPDASGGAQVVELTPEGAANGNGVRVGDVVMRIDDAPVQDPIDALNAVKRAEISGKKAVALLINRAGANRFIGVPLGALAG